MKVALEVEVSVPTVRFPMEEEAINSLTALNIVANRFVVVAFVAVKLPEIKALP